MLANIQPAPGSRASSQPQQAPLELMEVLALVSERCWSTCNDAAVQAGLAEHLPPPPAGARADTVQDTLASPQLQQAAASVTQALNGLGGAALVAELRLNPAGYGVEPFLRALQEATDAANAMQVE